MSNAYIGGNLPLDTRVSIYIGGGAGALVVMNIDADCGGLRHMEVDSAFIVLLDGYTGHPQQL